MSNSVSYTESTLLLFVYGSLKHGRQYHRYLRNQEFMGDAKTQPLYQLFNCGAYPALVQNDVDGICIHGEVYQISQEILPSIDHLEGVEEGFYARKPVALQNPFNEQSVLAYFYMLSTESFDQCGDSWP